MIPNKVKITGYKRLKDCSTYLDRKLIAVVGANEAGKSTLLNALLSIENDDEYKINELTKGNNFNEDDAIVRVEYLIEKDELYILKEYNGIGDPRYYYLSKAVNGRRTHGFTGEVRRNKKHRNLIQIFKLQSLSKSRAKKLINSLEYSKQDEEGDIEETIPLTDLIEQLLLIIDADSENFEDDDFELINQIIETITNPNLKVSVSSQNLLDEFSKMLEELIEIEKQEHPSDSFLKHLDTNRPQFVFFSNDERFLETRYSLEDLQDPSGAIINLLKVGKVDLDSVLDSITNENTGDRLTLLERVNSNLKNEYSKSWSQALVYPQFLFDIDSIKIQIKSIDGYNEITDRSDGLKQYISLKAFLVTRNLPAKPVLLIDEAEMHLHYSAQADLINEFERQEVVNSILYTTHSAGCLPSDLGTGIRSVEPIIHETKNTGISKIRNSIWMNDGGFSPILFAMGANIIAFTLARKAIIAEGPSETILLPRMFREALAIKNLDFQVAPGIASISKDNAALFELESAKTTYLVDGDGGGKANRTKLEKGGIDSDSIVDLPEGYSLEDFIEPIIIQKAINRELFKSGIDEIEFELNKISSTNRILWFEKQCNKLEIKLPNKVRIAENITKENSNINILDKSRKRQLKSVYNKIIKLLN